MSLQTPSTIRARQWKLLSQGEDTLRAGVSSRDTSIERPTIEGLAVKPIGKPSAGNRHARFDERGWETERWPLAPSYRAHPRLYLKTFRHAPPMPAGTLIADLRSPSEHAAATISARCAVVNVGCHGRTVSS